MAPPAPLYTFRAVLDGETYQYIAFYKWALDLSKTNLRPVHCHECGSQFPVGECVYHRCYRANFFLCIDCAKNAILRYGQNGFGVNVLFNLVLCHYSTPKFTAEQVAASLTRFTCTLNENGLVILHN
ncbi:MAG: hypothetical protein JETCAE01_35910 [Anaerolineaceae bacterium]|mgnify:FL=1|nr:MAG: hypothetical protein JETCAE01_35910 [Anaerolineaceae bacterium]